MGAESAIWCIRHPLPHESARRSRDQSVADRAGTRVRIICVGHAALDRVFTVDQWPTGSAKIVATSFEESGGGMAANAAVAIGRLGADVAFWGPTGDDATADVIKPSCAASTLTCAISSGFPVCARQARPS